MTFWHSRWTGEVVFRNRFPFLFAESPLKHLSVNDWLRRLGTATNFGTHNTSEAAIRELAELRALLQLTQLNSQPDVPRWRWSRIGNFTPRNAYLWLASDGVLDCRIKHLWAIRAPNKVKIFLWLAARNRIPTVDLLAKRGWVGPSICCMCGRDSETLEHLLFRCAFAIEVWEWVLHNEASVLGELLCHGGNLVARLLRTRATITGRRKHILDSGLAAMCWELWLERNRRTFNDKSRSSLQCGNCVLVTAHNWARALGD